MNISNLGVLIMAAGESRRFDGCKLLADLHGQPIINHALEQSDQLDSSARIVVSGRWHQSLENARKEGVIPECDLVFNPDWIRGLGNSISFGVTNLGEQCDAILILLADQVDIDVSKLRELIDCLGSHQIACAKYNGLRGVPAVFSKAMFPHLITLNGENGAKALLTGKQFDVVELEMPAAAVDIDTRDQLTAYVEKGPRSP